MKAETALNKKPVSKETISFVTRNLGIIRGALDPAPGQKAEEIEGNLAELKERKHFFRKLLSFVPQVINKGTYSHADVGTTPEELQRFSTLLN